jgi:hypothetical protein
VTVTSFMNITALSETSCASPFPVGETSVLLNPPTTTNTTISVCSSGLGGHAAIIQVQDFSNNHVYEFECSQYTSNANVCQQLF